MACQTLLQRVEYCLENIEMRHSLNKIRSFSHIERKMESVSYMLEIKEKKAKFDSLI